MDPLADARPRRNVVRPRPEEDEDEEDEDEEDEEDEVEARRKRRADDVRFGIAAFNRSQARLRGGERRERGQPQTEWAQQTTSVA